MIHPEPFSRVDYTLILEKIKALKKHKDSTMSICIKELDETPYLN